MNSLVKNFILLLAIFNCLIANSLAVAGNETDDPFSPAALWENLNRGWPRSVEEGISRDLVKSNKNYILIYATAPAMPLDLRSPDHLKQALSAQLLQYAADKATGGHMMVGWQCQRANGVVKGMTGISGERKDQAITLMRSGWGLNAYLANFHDGNIQDPVPSPMALLQAQPENYSLQKYFNQDLPQKVEFNFLIIEVSGEQCEQGRNFAKTFIEKNRRGAIPFGVLPNPNNFEGAGCLSFADSFLGHAQVLRNIFAHFWRNVILPEEVFGEGQRNIFGFPVYTDKEGKLREFSDVHIQTQFVPRQPRYLGFHTLFNMPSWNPYPGSRNFQFRQIDPELFYLFVHDLAEKIISDSAELRNDRGVQRHFAKRRRIDRLNFSGQTPEETFMTEMIDKNYDQGFGENAGRLAQETQNWFNSQKNQTNFRVFPFHYGYGIKIELKE